eukprot:1256705-Rhodomonas_salina.3
MHSLTTKFDQRHRVPGLSITFSVQILPCSRELVWQTPYCNTDSAHGSAGLLVFQGGLFGNNDSYHSRAQYTFPRKAVPLMWTLFYV